MFRATKIVQMQLRRREIMKRETFDEHWITGTRYQFFEPKLWRWHWPKLSKTENEILWVLPTMSVRWFR